MRIYTPPKIQIKFWGDLPEIKLGLKNPPDWTPPPNDDDDGPSTPNGPNSGVGASGRSENQVRLGVSNGCPAWIRTRNHASKGQCDTISPPGNIIRGKALSSLSCDTHPKWFSEYTLEIHL